MTIPPKTKDNLVRQTVVVVDDSATMRAVIQKELEKAGFEVVTFSDGLEALSSLRWMHKPPDLVTLDIDMPRMDGFTCCQHLREMERDGLIGHDGGQIPVLFVSAGDTLANRSRGFHLGSLDFIAKPFRRGAVAAAVSKILRPQSTFVGMTALVVDDNPGVRQMVRSCLHGMGLTILEAKNGQQAYELIRQQIDTVDIAIVDCEMPVMRGDEFIHLARQLPEAEHLPMLALSGTADANGILRMFRAGATDYLSKPFIAEELLARVQVHLQLRRHIRSLEELNRNLYEKAVNDGLTGLRNKRYFLEAFDEMFARAMRIGIDLGCLFFDLDYFKKVNDTCGHGFGDYVLKTVGDLVREVTSSGDLAARYGGEEFVIALPNGGLEQARSMAEQLRLRVEAFHFTDQDKSWPVTLSVGVASLRAHTPATASALLQLADQALYTAKGTGRNRVVCSPG